MIIVSNGNDSKVSYYLVCLYKHTQKLDKEIQNKQFAFLESRLPSDVVFLALYWSIRTHLHTHIQMRHTVEYDVLNNMYKNIY